MSDRTKAEIWSDWRCKKSGVAMEARLKQELPALDVNINDKDWARATMPDWPQELAQFLACRERQLRSSRCESAALHETIATLRADATKAAEALARCEQLVCDFQASGMIDVGGMKGPCEVKPIHIENHVTELRAELARERERHQRGERQRKIGEWAVAAFGEAEALSLPQRGLRLLEEAAEAAQATGVDADQALYLMRYVWGRPVGRLSQEIGGVGVTMLALAHAAGFSADGAELNEIARVLAKPLEHFTKRNKEKNDAGLLAQPAPVATGEE